MIYYFSGTGNSLHVARQLSDALGERLMPMTLAGQNASTLRGGFEGSIGLVFPVHAWGIPNVVEKIIPRLLPQGGEAYLFAVLTCGDDMGYADNVLESALGRKLDAAFSVQMPNTYVCLPGFDVDSDELCKKKLSKVEARVKEIATSISERKSTRSLNRGAFPWTKTHIIRPLFNRHLVTDKYFNVDASRCVSCGRCRKSCPVGNIVLGAAGETQLKEYKEIPQWQMHCTGCLACYHACPHHAINFGSMTQKKGQYDIMKQLYG